MPICVRFLGATCLLVIASVGNGCAHSVPPPVKAYEREHLAKRAMRMDDEMEAKYRTHLFGAREGADIGFGTSGGGCGCN